MQEKGSEENWKSWKRDRLEERGKKDKRLKEQKRNRNRKLFDKRKQRYVSKIMINNITEREQKRIFLREIRER